MTDRERSVARLRKLIKTAHGENRDFVYLTVENAKVIVRLLEEMEVKYVQPGRSDETAGRMHPAAGGMDG